MPDTADLRVELEAQTTRHRSHCADGNKEVDNHAELEGQRGIRTEAHDRLGSTSQQANQRWNAPVSNIAKVFATYYSFVLLGANDSSSGVLLPHLETYYGITYIEVSLIFLSPVAGFIVSTLANHTLHVNPGRRGIACLSGTCQLVAYIIASIHPPFYGLVIAYLLVGLGAGTKQASWNSFIGGLHNANELLGLLHGSYGLGATLLPVVVSSLFDRAGWQWWMIYYVLAAMAAIDLTVSLSVWWKQGPQAYREMYDHKSHNTGASETATATRIITFINNDGSRLPRRVGKKLTESVTFKCLKNRSVILGSFYLLSYVGAEIGLGGWLVTFMTTVRHGSSFASGIAQSGLWAGITCGRIVLGFVTGRFFKSEMHAAVVYLILAMCLELMFWLIPNFVSSAICAAFLGFFLGPLFPCVIMCLSRLLPRSMQVSAIGICSAIGASGASIVPFTIGALAQAKGVGILQPVILALLAICLAIWLFMPRLPPRSMDADASTQ